MKEIGKLIELLCEYEDVYNWFATCTIRGEKSERELKSDYMLDEDQDIIQIYIISKKFGFIKWLVENDKIKIPHELDELPQIYGVDYNSNECKSDRLIMLLSISSSPIEDLISYLK